MIFRPIQHGAFSTPIASVIIRTQIVSLALSLAFVFRNTYSQTIHWEIVSSRKSQTQAGFSFDSIYNTDRCNEKKNVLNVMCLRPSQWTTESFWLIHTPIQCIWFVVCVRRNNHLAENLCNPSENNGYRCVLLVLKCVHFIGESDLYTSVPDHWCALRWVLLCAGIYFVQFFLWSLCAKIENSKNGPQRRKKS